MDIEKNNIDQLPELLGDIVVELDSKDESGIEVAYGTDEDVLVLIPKSTDLEDNFINSAGDIVEKKMDDREKDIGLIISESPENYENKEAIYIRINPDEPREYVIPFCRRLGIERSEMAVISTEADKEKDCDNPKEMATVLIAENQLMSKDGVSLQKISDVTNLDLSTLRDRIMNR